MQAALAVSSGAILLNSLSAMVTMRLGWKVKFDMCAVISCAAIEALAEAFNQAHFNIEVKPSGGWGVFTGRFGLAEVAQKYDCLAWSTGVDGETIEQLYSLDPLLAQETQLLDDFDPALLDQIRVDGQYLACIADIADDGQERRDACAQAADAEYKTLDELFQDVGP
jgi:hypothetical protein